ncbi:MAG: hypothetical protein CTY12_00470 [Methylotenera sp.]|nr:MAG: hypothetical protein CTY12_00470 [Methylotenera sp.]
MKKPFYLVPVLATVLAGCSDGTTEAARDQYLTKADCVQEWSEEQCETYTDQYQDYDDNGNTANFSDVYFFGPEYPPRWVDNGVEYGGRQSIRGFHDNPGALRGVSSFSGRPGSISSSHMSGTARSGFGGVGMGRASAS